MKLTREELKESIETEDRKADIPETTNISWMFANLEPDEDIHDWNIRGVNETSSMFGSSKFPSNIGDWVVREDRLSSSSKLSAWIGIVAILIWCTLGMYLYLDQPEAYIANGKCVEWIQPSGLKTKCPDSWKETIHISTHVSSNLKVKDLPDYYEQK